MKVILLENIKRVGSIGEIIDVKRGFARNFLIANKKALYASKENINQVEKIKTQLSKKVCPEACKNAVDRTYHVRNSRVMVKIEFVSGLRTHAYKK